MSVRSMSPIRIAYAIEGDSTEYGPSSTKATILRDAVMRLPAAKASMAALLEVGCSTVVDFFSYLSSTSNKYASIAASSTPAAASQRPHDDAAITQENHQMLQQNVTNYTAKAAFKIIILADYEAGFERCCSQLRPTPLQRMKFCDPDIPSALHWDHRSVIYVREKYAGGLIHMVEDATLQWGVDALFFYLSSDQFRQIVYYPGFLTTIPPVTTLCLSSSFGTSCTASAAGEHKRDLRLALGSYSTSFRTSFTHLFVTAMDHVASLHLDAQHLDVTLRVGLTSIMSSRETREASQTSTSIQSIFIANMTNLPMCLSWEDELATIVKSHPSLSSFTLFGFSQVSYLQIIDVLFLRALRDIHHLTSFSLDSSKSMRERYDFQGRGKYTAASVDDSRRIVLDSLRRHGTLHQVNLDGTPLAGDTVIAAQLKKNAEHADRIKLLKAEGFQQVRPSAIRLYLCGLPLSGKTSVSRSLASWSKGSLYPWLRFKGSLKFSERTRGIEVTMIEDQLEQQSISVWDMAGQLEYHSFHDSMLPDLGDLAIPSLFMFVWNPFKTNEKGQLLHRARGGGLVLKSPDEFRDDFKYWLRFLASKTPKSNNLKPKVVVVVTRADLGPPDMKVELQTSFKSLRVEFEEYIHLDVERLFQVDARDPRKMLSLGCHLLQCAKAILEETPNEFHICNMARKLFADWTRKGTIPPLISKERFFQLIQQNLGGIHEEMCEAIALSLNGSGDVIFFPSLELVVMDTQWFCQKIMGDILHFNMNSSGTYCEHTGFFSLHSLKRLLEQELNLQKPTKWRLVGTRNADKSPEAIEVAGGDLVKLLTGLQLACPRDYTREDSEIFLPASLCGQARGRLLPSKYLNPDENYVSYVGRRFIVRDSICTFLTPGIFPRLQVTFHKMLTTQGINVELEQDVMAFADSGSRVLVEFCALEGKENFIDILVCSRRTADEALEWVHGKVIAEMMKVFADPRGIPGVEFMHSVIQPACIRGLMEASQRQAVPIQVLRDILREHVEKKGAKLMYESVMYTWQTVPLVDDLVVSLLGEAEVVKIVEAYRGSLSEVAADVLHLSVEDNNNRQKLCKFGNTESEKQREAIYDLLCEMRAEIRADMKQLSQQVDELRGAILSRLRELFTFVKEGEAGKLPRMFVVTEDDGLVRKVVCKMVSGLHKLRLELLCECRNEQTHLVDGQHGLSITTLDDVLLKRGLPYIHGFLKIAYAATKIGAHVAVGIDGLIPDFTNVLARITNVPEFGPSMQPFSSSRMDLRNGQQWLFNVLSHCDCTRGEQIYAQFGLRRIRYADSAVAWVCDKHYSGGKPWPA